VRKTAFLQLRSKNKILNNALQQLRKHYLQTEKQKKKMLQAINQMPLETPLTSFSMSCQDLLYTLNQGS
jgi:hypothetical protein